MSASSHKSELSLNWWLLRLSLWLGIITFSLICVAHLVWIAVTPKGFWRIPSIRVFAAPTIPNQSGNLGEISIPLTPGIPALQPRISPDDLSGISPGQRILVIDRMYIADNQPNVFRVSILRLLISYPWFFLLLLLSALRVQTRLTSRSTRTPPA